ncbi:zinc ABC transporter ATP-binding protein AztA [Microbacterium sp. M28]|uniref:zinc ABC transporter ATP-binding protein AztA n=1 Tax=Microbacterium sp. M28 TaxID=2962064 RepID=UPI0021F49844|nr:zinc ABC transporter ATP-binding protein AztA [Microbacterium sp. M28]UYO97565.1 zinc ABC transporter ATP-binding protein AztA [Microbacterium sp. M28]
MSSVPVLLPTTLVLSVRDVAVGHDGHPALRGIDVDAHAGRLLVVSGPNGSGKSTLLSVAAGLLTPQSGTVEVRPGTRTALVPQSTPLPAHLPLTVFDLVAMGTWARLGFWRPARKADRAAVTAAIAKVGLTGLSRRRIGTLSGGQRQRALLAQALVQRADLVLLDEPMAALDAHSRTVIADAVDHLVATGAAVIAVTHDPGEFHRIDDRLALEDGRVVELLSERTR